MQTNDKKGIMCDLCGKKIYGKILEYYDMSVNKISVDFVRKSTFAHDEGMKFDICQKCYDRIKDIVKEKTS